MKLKPYGEGGEQGGLAMEENKDGDGSGMADRAEGRTADLGASVRRLRLACAWANTRVERGRQ